MTDSLFDRYNDDAQFAALVNTFYSSILQERVTPEDLKDAAKFAATVYRVRNPGKSQVYRSDIQDPRAGWTYSGPG